MGIVFASFNENGSMVIVTRDDGSMSSVPADAENPRHVELLEELKAAGKSIAPWTPPPIGGEDIAAECQRRIYAVASHNCQMNMTAYVASGAANEDDRAAFAAALAWVSAMRAAYATLASAADPTFADDAHWPVCPAEAATLAARF